jgi:hypothetical protein
VRLGLQGEQLLERREEQEEHRDPNNGVAAGEGDDEGEADQHVHNLPLRVRPGSPGCDGSREVGAGESPPVREGWTASGKMEPMTTISEPEAENCRHDLAAGTCSICKMERPDARPPVFTTAGRRAYHASRDCKVLVKNQAKLLEDSGKVAVVRTVSVAEVVEAGRPPCPTCVTD